MVFLYYSFILSVCSISMPEHAFLRKQYLFMKVTDTNEFNGVTLD